MGISKFIEIGPISFLLSAAVASRRLIFAIKQCSWPP